MLVGPINVYLSETRPLLLGAKTSEALWISQRGTPLTLSAFERDMPAITKHHLAVALGPQAFRHVAATSIATQNPAHVGITREVLGHSTIAMAEKHYNHSTSLESCNALQSIVLQDIKKARRLYPVIRPKSASKATSKRAT